MLIIGTTPTAFKYRHIPFDIAWLNATEFTPAIPPLAINGDNVVKKAVGLNPITLAVPVPDPTPGEIPIGTNVARLGIIPVAMAKHMFRVFIPTIPPLASWLFRDAAMDTGSGPVRGALGPIMPAPAAPAPITVKLPGRTKVDAHAWHMASHMLGNLAPTIA
jgi:hypothetical protein